MTTETNRRPPRPLHLLVMVVLLFAACGGSDPAAGPARGADSAAPPASDTGAGRVTLTDLSGVDELKDAFNRDEGVARLVLVLSPT